MTRLDSKWTSRLACALGALAFAGASWAVDGVVLIDQAKVNAAGGFPYKISQSGSYRLAGHLNIAFMGRDTNAIEIVPPVAGSLLNVSLDFNGFAILGNPVCDLDIQGDISCGAQGGGNGVVVDAAAMVTLTNGAVRGMGNQGILCLGFCRIEGMTIANNGGFGISILRGGLVSSSNVALNRTGLSVNNAAVSYSVVQWSRFNGIVAANSTIVGNSVHGNMGAGLAGAGNAYANNHFAANAGGGAQVAGGNVQTGGNVCNGVACP